MDTVRMVGLALLAMAAVFWVLAGLRLMTVGWRRQDRVGQRRGAQYLLFGAGLALVFLGAMLRSAAGLVFTVPGAALVVWSGLRTHRDRNPPPAVRWLSRPPGRPGDRDE